MNCIADPIGHPMGTPSHSRHEDAEIREKSARKARRKAADPEAPNLIPHIAYSLVSAATTMPRAMANPMGYRWRSQTQTQTQLLLTSVGGSGGQSNSKRQVRNARDADDWGLEASR